MFGYSCAYCGWKEIAHTYDLEKHLNDSCLRHTLPDLEYGEELDEDEIKELGSYRRGYRYHLVTCPGFNYSAKVTEEMLVLGGLDHPSAVWFLEDHLQERVRDEIRRQKEKQKPSDLASYGGCHTYIQKLPDGRTVILVGE